MELQNKKKLSPSEVLDKIKRDVPLLIAHHEITQQPEPIQYRYKKTPRDT